MSLRPNLGNSPLAKWLNRVGMSRKDFGQRIGMSSAAKLNEWMEGQRSPTLAVMYEIERLTEGQVPIEAWLGTKQTKGELATLRQRQPDEYKPKKFAEDLKGATGPEAPAEPE
jgi:transcriptional regulator with XRE-family HTH domain